MELADIHCHIMPYVDDGAQNYDEALELLRMEAKENVKHICLTPHLRQDMFDTSDAKILKIGRELAKLGTENNIPIRLHLSREYYFDDRTAALIKENKVIPMGEEIQTLLIEFSYDSHFADILEACKYTVRYGYVPLVAHVERYFTVQNEPEKVKRLINTGALLQLNASAVIGNEDKKRKKTCDYLLAQHLITVVASDAHDIKYRIPELDKCAKLLTRKFGIGGAKELMYNNPMKILKGTNG